MNKQKLIEELECLEIPADSYSYFRGAKYVVERAISLAKQLDEPKKAVLPKTADDFIKEGEKLGSDKMDIIDSAIFFSKEVPRDEFSLWLKSNRNLFVDALANGYEVEKEPLYAIKGLTDYFRYENKVILFNDKQEALDIANKIGEYCSIEEFDYANNSNFILSKEF